jgi:hypothetical protein
MEIVNKAQIVVESQVICCEYCGKPVDNSWIGTGTGRAHPTCYYKRNPPRYCTIFPQVLNNIDDQVFVRELLHTFVPSEIKERIVDEFNAEMSKRHELRISR